MTEPIPIDLRRAFLERQKLLSAELELPLQFTRHPTAIGDATEANWGRMLGSFLPSRYAIGPVFALDAHGQTSQQVDLAIYDRQYSPLWFEAGGHLYVPVESVYAAFEVKQNINLPHLRYAAKKVASVRGLHRTSARIVDLHGTHEGPPLDRRPILGGIVALRCDWRDGLAGQTSRGHIESFVGDEHLDLALALEDTSFDNIPATANLDVLEAGLRFAREGTQLIWFVMHLFRRLQSIGTALAVDLTQYEAVLQDTDVSEYTDVDQ